MRNFSLEVIVTLMTTAKKIWLIIGILIASPFALLLCNLIYIFAALHWPSYKSLVTEEGNPIVEAMYKFKSENGIWPQYLNDLVPKYLKEKPEHWQYTSTLTEPTFPHIYYRGPKVPLKLGFSCGNKNSTWVVSSRELSRALRVKPLFAETQHLSPEEINNNTVTQLHRRIEREPNEIKHCMMLISFLFKHQLTHDAIVESKQCITTFGNHWWPRVALAVILLKNGNRSGIMDLNEWVKANPNFFNYYNLGCCWRIQNEPNLALDAFREASKYMITTPKDTPYVDVFYGKQAAYYAYCQQDYLLATQLSNRIEELPRYYNEQAYAMQAAVSLAIGDFKKAQDYAQKIIKLDDWQKSEYRELLDAVKKSNQSFKLELFKDEIEPEFWGDF